MTLIIPDSLIAPDGAFNTTNDLSKEYPDRKPLPDSDDDGMPDDWEIANGLNPDDASDAIESNLSAKATGVEGFTNIEVYINALADKLVSATPSKRQTTKPGQRDSHSRRL